MKIKNYNIKIPLALLVCLALLLAFAGWEIFKYQVVPRRFGIVERDRIFRSGRIAPHLMRRAVLKHNIKVIVDLTDSDPKNSSVQAELKIAEELGVRRYNFPLCGDGTGNITNYANAIAAIARSRDEKKPVLVHCAAGAQRTGGVIAAYRLLVEKQPPETVSAELARYGWKSRKDMILLEYLNPRMEELNALLQDMGVIRRERRSFPKIAP